MNSPLPSGESQGVRDADVLAVLNAAKAAASSAYQTAAAANDGRLQTDLAGTNF